MTNRSVHRAVGVVAGVGAKALLREPTGRVFKKRQQVIHGDDSLFVRWRGQGLYEELGPGFFPFTKHTGGLRVGGGIADELRARAIEVRWAEGLQAVNASEFFAAVSFRELKGFI